MATGFSRSIEGEQNMIYNYCCTTCAHQNLNIEALFYCNDCKKLICEECNKYHAMYFEGHNVLGRKEVARWGNVKPVTSSFMCDVHPWKEEKMYCEEHGVVCCDDCVSLVHGCCKVVKPVSDVSIGIGKKSEFLSFLSKAAKTKRGLNAVYDIQENNIKMLQKTRGKITASFKNMRKKINQIMDRLEEDSTTELDTLLTMLKEQVKIDQDACSDFIDKIQKLLDDIQTLGKQSDEFAFRCYKKCSKQVASADKLLSSMQNVDFQIKFIPDSKLEHDLSTLKALGNFYLMPNEISHSFKYKGFAPLRTPPDHAYSIQYEQACCVKTNLDRNTCNITGICQLPDGLTAIVDKGNSKVKLLDASLEFEGELKLPSYPQDICHTTGTEMAVTVYWATDNRLLKYFMDPTMEIHFINVRNGKLSHTRTVELDHQCFGIAYHNAQLYVGSCNALYVYTQSGEKVKKVYEDTIATHYISEYRCCLSDDGSRIYVTNPANDRLLTLDSSGNLLSTLRLRDRQLLMPLSVCIADNGSVFVRDNYNLLQVDRKGKRIMTTLNTRNGRVFPKSLCYDRKTHTLLVGQENHLLVLKMK